MNTPEFFNCAALVVLIFSCFFLLTQLNINYCCCIYIRILNEGMHEWWMLFFVQLRHNVLYFFLGLYTLLLCFFFCLRTYLLHLPRIRRISYITLCSLAVTIQDHRTKNIWQWQHKVPECDFRLTERTQNNRHTLAYNLQHFFSSLCGVSGVFIACILRFHTLHYTL